MCFSFATLKSSLKDEFAIFKFFLDLKRNSLVHLVSLFQLARIFDIEQQKGMVQIIIIKKVGKRQYATKFAMKTADVEISIQTTKNCFATYKTIFGDDV